MTIIKVLATVLQHLVKMKFHVLVMIVTSIHCVLSSETVYYITPQNDTCYTSEGSTSEMMPCYSLQQLSRDRTVLTNKTVVTLLLQTGIHSFSDQLLTVSDIRKVVLSPLNGEHNIEIHCQLQSRFVFQNVEELQIFSLKFTFCSLECIGTSNNVLNPFGNRLQHITLSFVNCEFVGSTDYAITIKQSTGFKFNASVSNCTFLSNNGAIACNPGLLLGVISAIGLLVKQSSFFNNQRDSDGGALYASKVNLRLEGSSFVNNSAAASGGAIYALGSTMLIDGAVFQGNHARIYGGAVYSLSSSLNTGIHNSWLIGNSALQGGAAYIFSTEFELTHTVFTNNFAEKFGGAIFSTNNLSSDCDFTSNSAGQKGGAIYLFNAEDAFGSITDSSFISNQAENDGGALYCEGTRGGNGLTITDSNAHSNVAMRGGFIFSLRCELSVLSYLSLAANEAESGGAMYFQDAVMVLSGTFLSPLVEIVLEGNIAFSSGGALFMDSSQIIIDDGLRFSLEQRSMVIFRNNTATSASGKGGAIFVRNSRCEVLTYDKNSDCFVGLTRRNTNHLTFVNNQATYGSVVYGGLLDRCFMDKLDKHLLGRYEFRQIAQYKQTSLAVTSDPIRVCLCINDTHPNCLQRELTVSKVRGGIIHLLLASVDQEENPRTSSIRAFYNNPFAELDKGEGKKDIGDKCSSLSYHVYTALSSAVLSLHPVSDCEQSEFSSLSIHITVENCSRGFEQSGDRCVCDKKSNITVCNVDTDTIKGKESVWLRYNEEYFQLHQNCPFDYCSAASDTISFLSPDEQCTNYRGGVLCGGCQENYSIVLGSLKCLHCTSKYTFIWLTVLFAVAGVVLVAVLLVCNMTISRGTLNGLIFYANIASISGLTNLQNCSIHPILSVFIAWINLDLGIETCFYPGMYVYQKTWLQFAFPTYIWLLVLLVIVACHYSSTAVKIFGSNNIAILATLFLLSYSKILKTIATALSFTEVLKSSADDVNALVLPYKVWLHDGNVEYFKGKHAVLFAAALFLLLFLFLPYTLLLTFGQCVRSSTVRNKYFSRCIHSAAFISVMDAYHAPYKKRFRYWTGLRLLTRCLLFLIFAISYRQDEILTNTYATTLVISGIFVMKTCTRHVYKNFYFDILELCFLLNLFILSATLYYLKTSNHSNEVICKSTNASITISFAVFIGIVSYHTYLKIEKTKFCDFIRRIFCKKLIVEERKEEDTFQLDAAVKTPTTSYVELREELLTNDAD